MFSYRKLIFFSVLALLSAPIVGLAQAPPGQLQQPINVVVYNLVVLVLNVLWMVAIAVVVIMFVMAGFKYLTAQGDPSKVSEAHKAVIWGAAGTGVVILAWSVLAIIRATLGV